MPHPLQFGVAPTQIGVQIGVRVCPVPMQGDGIMEAPAGAEMTETVIETGLEATIGQIIPIQVNISDEFELRFPKLSRAELKSF